MQILIGNRRATIDKDTVIGQGGEAVVHKDPDHPNDMALKIYHTCDVAREAKLKDFMARRFPFPESVVAPIAPIWSDRRKLIGFQMRRLNPRYRKFNMMFRPSYCRDHELTTKTKADIFYRMGRDLIGIHALGVVVGDLNDGNEMLDEERYRVAWIDTDSWQFGKYPCMVGSKLYLTPDLYNIDLTKRPVFEAEHDWWSYTVLLFRALLDGVHPFKSGTHPRWDSLLDRAEHGLTVLDPEVTFPNVGLSPDILTDDLADRILTILKRTRREPFPLDALKEYGDILMECGSCHVWYPAKRSHCPSCAHRTTLDMAMMAKVAGFEVRNLIVTRGRILFYQNADGRISCLAEEDGGIVLYQQEGDASAARKELNITVPPGAQFGMFNGLVIICPDPADDAPELFVLDVAGNEPRAVKALTTSLFAGDRAVFSASSRFLYRIAGRTLLAGARFGDSDVAERPVMQVFEGQTWFVAAKEPGSDQELLVGFHREFGDLHWFLVRGNAAGTSFTRFMLAIPTLDPKEAMRDFSARFTRSNALILRKTEQNGRERIRIDVVATDDGRVESSSVAEVPNDTRWDSVHGKAYSNGLILHATDHGIVREGIASHVVGELPLTTRYVDMSDSLDRLGDGVIAVKQDRVIIIRSA